MKIQLTENIETRDARMWQKFLAAGDAFARHVVLVMWGDNVNEAKARFIAWSEGPKGFTERADHSTAYGTYKGNIARNMDEMGL